MKITIIGAGNMGRGLAMRFAKAGHEITFGSFSLELAEEAAEKVRERSGCTRIHSAENRDAAAWADVVVLVIPSASHREVLESLKDLLQDKLLLDITVPMAMNPVRYAPPAQGSNALEAREILGEGSHVAAGFHTISAKLLNDLSSPLSGSTLIVAGDDDSAKTAMQLAEDIGLTPVYAGGLQLAQTVESLTPLLLSINKRYGSTFAGIQVTGI